MPTKGTRFRHARWVNWDVDKTPALYEVTRIALNTVYYRPVYDAGIVGSERLGSPECCSLAYWPKVCLRLESETIKPE